MKCNIGSGADYRTGWLNIEAYPESSHHTGETIPPDMWADAHTLPIKPNTLSHVRLSHVLEHLERPLDALRDAHRALEAGGTLYVEVPHAGKVLSERDQHLYSWTPDTFQNIVQTAGFRIKEYEDAPKEYPAFSSHVHWIHAHAI